MFFYIYVYFAGTELMSYLKISLIASNSDKLLHKITSMIWHFRCMVYLSLNLSLYNHKYINFVNTEPTTIIINISQIGKPNI